MKPALRKVMATTAGLMLLLAVVVAVFVWDEARKEVVFLCGNFKPGMDEANVLGQLQTANLLRIERRPSPRHIHVDSAYNFGMYRCLVETDEDRTVVSVTPP